MTTDYLLGRVDTPSSVGAAEKIHRHLSNLSKSDLELADNFLEMLAIRNKKAYEWRESYIENAESIFSGGNSEACSS